MSLARRHINIDRSIAHGAIVVIADWSEEAGDALQSQLNSPRCLFHKTDVSNWDSVLSLFEFTFDTFGSVDVVCANAGTNAWDNLLSEDVDPHTGKLKAPTMKLMEVNLFGPIYTVKAAVHYFAKHPQKKPGQVIMTGSAASFFDTPPLYLYCSSKAGVLGLLRGMRTQLPRRNVTINMVAPWMTVTPVRKTRFHIREEWRSNLSNHRCCQRPSRICGVSSLLIHPRVRRERF